MLASLTRIFRAALCAALWDGHACGWLAMTGSRQACPATAALSKYALPGVRGSKRQELVLPFTPPFLGMIAAPLQQPSTRTRLAALLGHPVAIEFVSVIVSWPGADAQEYHRDAQAAAEANLLLFVPLDEMQARPGHAGPPELCRKPPLGRPNPQSKAPPSGTTSPQALLCAKSATRAAELHEFATETDGR